MASEKTIRETLLGVASISLIVTGGVLLYWRGVDEGLVSMLASSCLRAGAVLFALWLALPQLRSIKHKVPLWLLGGGAACLLVLVVSPKAFIVVGPLFALIAFLKFVGWLFAPPPGMKPRSKTAAKESSSSTGEGG